MKTQKTSSLAFEGSPRTTPLPNRFFSELLPIIDHLGELKITLYAFWAIEKRESRFRYIRLNEMLEDQLLLEAMHDPDLNAKDTLMDALERAVVRGTLLKVELRFMQGPETFFFLNTKKGKAAVEAIKEGKWQPGDELEHPIELRHERPNLFTLYEQNIGPLTPMIADELRDAEASYPESWIEEAVRIAVENNVRKWSYINAILEGWRSRGKDARKDRGDTEKARRQYLKGWFDD